MKPKTWETKFKQRLVTPSCIHGMHHKSTVSMSRQSCSICHGSGLNPLSVSCIVNGWFHNHCFTLDLRCQQSLKLHMPNMSGFPCRGADQGPTPTMACRSGRRRLVGNGLRFMRIHVDMCFHQPARLIWLSVLSTVLLADCFGQDTAPNLELGILKGECLIFQLYREDSLEDQPLTFAASMQARSFYSLCCMFMLCI